jgi:tRNA1(Val) A37 N6-methylase TrmN6
LRAQRRPAGWVAPGPRPPESPARAELWPDEAEDLCWLAGDWRILQRLDGHRWSLDDLATAWFAASECASAPDRAIDIGCGIGTVLMFLAWRFPATRFVGVEAQALSASMARRSLAWNGVESRCEIRDGDLRDASVVPEGASFPLVTGTPPYFPPGSGIESDREQRAPCRFEHRGGIEAYCEAAARLLSPGGLFVACEASGQAHRVDAAARAAGLSVEKWLDFIPREGKPPLFAVFSMRHRCDTRDVLPPLTVRDARGRWTPEFRKLRDEMGLPPGEP